TCDSGGAELLHTTSLIRYPCFYRGKNYSGHTPSIASAEILRHYIGEFAAELGCLHDLRVIIPLGTAVEAILRGGTALPENCAVLWGFPHPSGLNARRKDQFEAVRERLSDVLRHCGL
ncbi:MAG: hypothetical protein IKM31_01470, partial [Oscillospiraceae bacterium]|nr:hypothetical protein [Oscillospiraceae bacterium]